MQMCSDDDLKVAAIEPFVVVPIAASLPLPVGEKLSE